MARPSSALMCTAWYAALAAGWIVVSDSVLNFLGVPKESTPLIDIGKGLAFVGVTSLTLYLVLRRENRRLAASEERYRSLFNAEGQIMLVTDPVTGAIVDASPGAARFYGYAQARMVTMTLADIAQAPGQTPDQTPGQAPAHANVRHRLASGEERDVEVYCGPVQIGDRQLLLSVIHDVTLRTEAQRAEAREARINEHLAVLAARLLDERQPLTAIAAEILDKGKALTGSRIGYVSTVDRRSGTLVASAGEATGAGPGPPDRDNRPSLPPGHPAIQRAVTAPAKIDQDVVGHVALANAERPYDLRDIQVVERLAVLFALAIRRNRTEEALRESEERYRVLVEALPESVLVFRDGQIVFANPAALALFGDRSLTGVTLAERIADPPNARVSSPPLLASGRTNAPVEVLVRHRNCRMVPAEFYATPISYDGQSAVLAIGRDITERKRVERELREARDRAAEANRAKTTFLATMGHELRTPLNAIIGFSEMITSRVWNDDEVDRLIGYARDIHKSGLSLLEMVEDILDLSCCEDGRRELAPEPFDLPEFVERLLPPVRGAAADHGLRLLVDLEPGEPAPPVFADRRGLRQILSALLGNAIKFTPRGGLVRLCARRREDGAVRLTVSDTGVGIPGDKLARILEPFVQLENRFDHSHPGTGLGLSLAERLVRLHGGRLSIESEPGAGTTVTVDLPGRLNLHAEIKAAVA